MQTREEVYIFTPKEICQNQVTPSSVRPLCAWDKISPSLSLCGVTDGGNGDPISTAATNDGRHVARCLFDSQRTVTNRREAKNHPAAAAASGRNVG